MVIEYRKLKLDPASYQYHDCYSLEELVAYKAGNLLPEVCKAVLYHLDHDVCLSCHRLFTELVDVGTEKFDVDNLDVAKNMGSADEKEESKAKQRRKERFGERFAELSATTVAADAIIPQLYTPPEPFRLEIGQFWVVRPAVGWKVENGKLPPSLPVMIVDPGSKIRQADNIVRVAPVSFDTDFANEPNTFTLLASDPLGYAALVEIFNEQEISASSLTVFRGTMLVDRMEIFQQNREMWQQGQNVPSEDDILTWQQEEVRLIASWLPTVVIQSEIRPLIELAPYAMAAAASEAFVPERSPYVHNPSPGVTIVIFQRRNQVLCRIVVPPENSEIVTVKIDHKACVMKKNLPGFYEVVLGQVDQIPQEVELECWVGDRSWFYIPRFVSSKIEK